MVVIIGATGFIGMYTTEAFLKKGEDVVATGRNKLLGKKSLIIYTGTIALLSLLFGFLYDTFFSELNILKFSTDNEETSIVDQISSLIILILISYYLVKSWFDRKSIKS